MNNQESTKYWEGITKYFSNEITEGEKSMFEKWAMEVDEQALLNEIKKDMSELDEAKYVFNKSTDQAWADLSARINEDEIKEPVKVKHIGSRKMIYQIAAALIIVFGLSWGIMQVTTNMKHETLKTEFAQTEIILPDGSIVSLNANSKLIYPKSFSGKTRNVELIGEGFFDITPNPDKPFIITANNAEIKVLGTKFNVIAHKDMSKVEVLVETGLVSLSSKSDANNSILLEKGEFGILNEVNLQETTLTDPNYLSWKTKVMEFRNEDLRSVLDIINHTYGSNIILDSEPLESLELTSKYDNISLDTLLQSICIAFNLEKSEIENQIILAIKEN